MNRPGFTLVEILIVVAIMSTLAGLVSLAAVRAQQRSTVMQCQSRVRNLALLLESTTPGRYPRHGGPNLLLHLVQRGHLDGPDGLEQLFCPGDLAESLDDAGGLDAYRSIDLRQRTHGALTSYAARAFDVREHRVPKSRARAVVLLADDSDDHHPDGFVVGLTGGVAKFRDRFDDWDLGKETPIAPGEDSPVEELRPLRAE